MEKRKLLHSSIQFIIVVFYFGTGEAIKCRKYPCVTVAVLSPVPPNWAFLFSSSLPLVWISDMETPSSPDSLGVLIPSIFSFFIIAFSMLFFFFALSPVIRIDRVRRQQQGSQFLLYTYIYIYIYIYYPFNTPKDRNFSISLQNESQGVQRIIWRLRSLSSLSQCCTYLIEKRNNPHPFMYFLNSLSC